MMENNKRKRVANFTTTEKLLLIKLVAEKSAIIESKFTDGNALLKKKYAWEEITNEFNSNVNVNKRNTINLKRAWDNLKAATRKARSGEGASLRKAGGRPAVSPEAPQQASLALFCEIKNSYDSDATTMMTVDHVIAQETREVLIPEQSIEREPQDPKSPRSQLEEAKNLNVCQSSRKTSDLIRREALIRLKGAHKRNRLEHEILIAKLQMQKKLKERADLLLQKVKIELETANMLQKVAQHELMKRNIE